MPFVISNSKLGSMEVVECADKAACQSNGCNGPDNQCIVLSYGWLFLHKVTLLLNKAYSYDITCDGGHGERHWAKCFEEASSAQSLLKEYESVHEEQLAKIGAKQEDAKPLPGWYTVYTIVIRHDYPLPIPSQAYHVGTICVYSSLNPDEKKRMSLDISPLHESYMDYDTSLKNIYSMCDHCVKQFHEFAEQQRVDETCCALSCVEFDYKRTKHGLYPHYYVYPLVS